MTDVYRRGRPIPLGVPSNAIVASAQEMTGSLTDHLIQNRAWQTEAWDFYHAMGEFWYGVTWLSNACSRVRLVAGKKQDGNDEPEILKSDATGADIDAVKAVASLGGGVGGHSAIMKSLAVQLSIPGEGYVVGEQNMDSQSQQLMPAVWSTKSSDELRRRSWNESKDSKRADPSRGISPIGGVSNPSPFEIQVEEGRWRPLTDESIVVRVWNPDEQYSFRAVSAALPALPILREIDLLNRRIIAELISRVAMNGILVIPDEITFMTRPEFKDAADPFVAQLIDTASKAIKTPGSASAALPMPLKVPAAFADKIQLIKFAEFLDPKLMEARDRAIHRLATTLNMPSEVLLGVADVNHWTAWQIDEQGVKMHIVPAVEVICQGLTTGFFRPTLIANGMSPQDAAEYVVWYDTSEITTKPDLTQSAKDSLDRGVISDEAYRREAGFSDDDAPDEVEMQKQLLRTLAFKGNTMAIKELTGLDLTPPQMAPNGGQQPGQPTNQSNPTKPPAPSEALRKQQAESSNTRTGPPSSGPPSTGQRPVTAPVKVG